MTPSDIETLANALQRQGISEFEIDDHEQGVGITFKLQPQAICTTQDTAPAATNLARAPVNTVSLLRSPGMGRFAACHPLLNEPAATAGRQVQAGQAVGYLLAGSLISEITASQAGVLGRQLVQEGDLLGYGDGVFEWS